MSRVLLTGATGTIGAAVVRRLLADPDYEVRVSDRRPAPRWMREGCEIHTGDLRRPGEAKKATEGCTHVIHLADAATATGIEADRRRLPYTLIETSNALNNAVTRAAIDLGVERFTFVSSALVFERASEFPTTEAHLPDCPTPRSARGFSELAGETLCRAAHDEHGLRYTICRPFDPYGPVEAAGAESGITDTGQGIGRVGPETSPVEPGAGRVIEDLIAGALAGRPLRLLGSGEQTRTPTHVDDIAAGIVTAMSSPGGENEDFNISASRELPIAEIARIVWQACGEDPADFAPEQLERAKHSAEHPETSAVDVPRRWPAVEKAEQLLGWRARIALEDGVAATVTSIRERGSIGSLP